MTRKLTSNDKTLENIHTRRDTFASALKNQYNFNKMLESQLAQLAAVVPPLEKGKVPGQPEDLETAKLVDIHNTTQCYIEPEAVQWIDHSLPEKMGDPGRPIIPISIGCHSFLAAIYDFGASVNIMPTVIYEKILNDPLLYTNMRLQLADQSICYPDRVLEEVVIRVGQSYVPIDFVVMETGVDEKEPIIMGRPFLCTTKPSSMRSTPRLSYPSRTRKRDSHSRNTS